MRRSAYAPADGQEGTYAWNLLFPLARMNRLIIVSMKQLDKNETVTFNCSSKGFSFTYLQAMMNIVMRLQRVAAARKRKPVTKTSIPKSYKNVQFRQTIFSHESDFPSCTAPFCNMETTLTLAGNRNHLRDIWQRKCLCEYPRIKSVCTIHS